MKEIAFQIDDQYRFVPASAEELKKAKNYHRHQIVRAKVSGFKKPRSYLQLKMFWACCKIVADNTEDQYWNTKEKVAFQVKVALQFIDINKTIVDPSGYVHLHYRSISFQSLPHMEANKFFDHAWPIMAQKIGVTVDELLENSNQCHF